MCTAKRTLLSLAICMVGLCLTVLPASAQQKATEVEATVHLDRPGDEIHPYVYGMFTELLSNMFENGVLAEMLSDRKFFYPVSNSAELTPKNTKAHQLRWRPVGDEKYMLLDTENPYVGKQTPVVSLAGGKAGISQSGLWLQNGRGYDGRVILSADNAAKVTVSLVWGEGAADRESIVFSPSKDYEKYFFHFTSGADTKDARLEIVGEGSGTFHIGAVSLMPDDNIKGLRKDLIDILRSVGAPVYRWPGGNFLANYDWRHGIGDPDKRPPRYDYAWNTVEYNDMGTDEYMTWCELIGCDPYIVVNAGFGDAFSAGQWVEYVNGDVSTPMGTWRAQNGHPEPYGVKYWGIGNEMYGEWQLGHMSPAHYSLKHNFIAEEMRAKDPSIKIVACGATIYETSTTARHWRKPLQYSLPVKLLSQDDWDGVLLSNSLESLDHISEHVYTYFNAHFDGPTETWVHHRDSLVDLSRRTPNRIKGMVETMEHYEEMIPGVKEKQPKFWVDEWVGGSGRGFRNNLGVANGLNEFIRNSDHVMMGAYTGFTGLYVYDDNQAVMSGCGYLFKLYIEHQGNIPLEVSGNSPQPKMEGTVGVDIPKNTSGSPTYPFDVVATSDDDKVVVTVVNPTFEAGQLKLNFDGGSFTGPVTVYALASPNIDDENSIENPDKVKVAVSTVKKFKGTVSVAPHSITLFEFKK